MNDFSHLKITGHLLIQDADTGETVLDKQNAIHSENMSLAIAQSLCKQSQGPIQSMVFGNGGAALSGVGTVTYFSPNVTGSAASLYNQTYSKIVNNLDTNDLNTSENNLTVSHVSGNLFSDIIVKCTLDYGEPAGQNSIDNSTNISGTYVFNEIGLMNYDGKLLTHVVFSPIEKSTNRSFVISYTLRIQLV